MDEFAKTPDSSMADYLEGLDDEITGRVSPIPLPWSKSTNLMGRGMYPGEVTMIAAPPGNGKTYSALEICLHAGRNGRTWAYLPMEDNHRKYMRRMVGVICNDWDVMDRTAEAAEYARKRSHEHMTELMDIRSNIFQNPRRAYRDESGELVIPRIPWERLLKWVGEEAQRRDLIVIDPISMINYVMKGENSQEWVEMQDFMQTAVGMIEVSTCHLLLLAHIGKRQGRGDRPLVMDDIQGAASFVRFAHNVLMLDKHEEKDCDVFAYDHDLADVITETKTHKRTLFIGKTRDGKGDGMRIAVSVDNGPRLAEVGVIAPRKKK